MKILPSEKKLLKTILAFAKRKKKKLYLVGGYLRDILLARDKGNLDIDFCLKKGSIDFGRQLAKKIKVGFVVLDKEHGACRLVKKIRDKTITLDFTDFRGRTLEEDLWHRDFTINSLALELDKIFNVSEPSDFLIDPYHARGDLEAMTLRAINKNTFVEDPLRILRAFAFACLFGFKIDRETLRSVRLNKNKLSEASAERMRDELFKILERPDAFTYLQQMDKLGVLKIIFPEIEIMRNVKQGPYHHLDIWGHTLQTLNQLELLIKELKGKKEIQDYMNEVVSSQRSRRALLKLGALLHDIGKPKALRHKNGKTTFYGHERIGVEMSEEIVRRLRLSNDEGEALKKIVFCHLRPGYLADNENITPRAKFRYFRDTAGESVSILLISLADQRSTKGPLTTKESRLRHEKLVFSLIREYFRKKKEKKVKRLINGHDLIKRFKLEPSPLVGRILREVGELQAIGRLRTKEEAFKLAKRFIK